MSKKAQTLILGVLIGVIAFQGESKTRGTPKLISRAAASVNAQRQAADLNDESLQSRIDATTLMDYERSLSDLDDSDDSVDEDGATDVMNIDAEGTLVIPVPSAKPSQTQTDAKDADASPSNAADNAPSNPTESLSKTKYIDAWVQQGVPENALRKAIAALDRNIHRTAMVPLDRAHRHAEIHTISVTNKRYLILNDFTEPSTDLRMYVLDFKTGKVMKSLVAHGDGTGMLNAVNFSRANVSKSHQTTPGFHVISEIYSGKHGLTYALDGLEERNKEARPRLVVLHAAPKYATVAFIKRHKYLGRSNGCPAVPPETMKKLLGNDYTYDKKTNIGHGYLSGAMMYNFTSLDDN